MAVASVMPLTGIGTEELPPVSLPSCRVPLAPQQDMVPSSWSAQEWLLPVAMAVAFSMPTTRLGKFALLFLLMI